MKYNINEIINSSFDFYDFSNHKKIKNLILNLKNNLSLKNINELNYIIINSNLEYYIKHHINIRLELLTDIINNSLNR